MTTRKLFLAFLRKCETQRITIGYTMRRMNGKKFLYRIVCSYKSFHGIQAAARPTTIHKLFGSDTRKFRRNVEMSDFEIVVAKPHKFQKFTIVLCGAVDTVVGNTLPRTDVITMEHQEIETVDGINLPPRFCASILELSK